jgi:hypothetical protein
MRSAALVDPSVVALQWRRALGVRWLCSIAKRSVVATLAFAQPPRPVVVPGFTTTGLSRRFGFEQCSVAHQRLRWWPLWLVSSIVRVEVSQRCDMPRQTDLANTLQKMGCLMRFSGTPSEIGAVDHRRARSAPTASRRTSSRRIAVDSPAGPLPVHGTPPDRT